MKYTHVPQKWSGLKLLCWTCIQKASPQLSARTQGIRKADSHIACRAHAGPLPCRSLIHTCHAALLPCSDSAVSFVKVRVVAGNNQTAGPTV